MSIQLLRQDWCTHKQTSGNHDSWATSGGISKTNTMRLSVTRGESDQLRRTLKGRKSLAVMVESKLPTYVPTYLPTYLSTFLPTYLPTYLTTYLPMTRSLRSLRQVATLRHGHIARRFAPAFKAVGVCEHS